MRPRFEVWFNTESPLRKLTVEIAGCDASNSPASSLFSGPSGSKPYNFLVNGVAEGWRPPINYTLEDAASWKSGGRFSLCEEAKHGFNSAAKGTSTLQNLGCSLLFDPLVDAFLAAHFLKTNQLPVAPTIIVLSDYGPWSQTVGKFNAGKDWGEFETKEILKNGGSSKDPTTKNLFGCLFGPEALQGNVCIPSKIAEKRILIWNFLPMFRGGQKSTGNHGLPSSGQWRNLCWEWLCEFASLTNASQVVLACSKEMLWQPMPIKKRPDQVKDARINFPLTRSGDQLSRPTATSEIPLAIETLKHPPACIKNVYRIYHPYPWFNKACNDRETLQEIILRTE